MAPNRERSVFGQLAPGLIEVGGNTSRVNRVPPTTKPPSRQLIEPGQIVFEVTRDIEMSLRNGFRFGEEGPKRAGAQNRGR